MQIRKLEPKDVEPVHRLGSQEPSFALRPGAPAFWTKEQLRRWFLSQDGMCLGAFNERTLIGFVLATIHQPTGKAVCENIFVVPTHRGEDIARHLMERLIDGLKRKGVFHIASMIGEENSRSFYLHRRLGFENLGPFRWLGYSVR